MSNNNELVSPESTEIDDGSCEGFYEIPVEYSIPSRDLEQVDYSKELEGSNESFFIQPTIVKESNGNFAPVYGVYNRETLVRETELRQYNSAKMWVDALTRAANGEDMPGLGPVEIREADEE